MDVAGPHDAQVTNNSEVIETTRLMIIVKWSDQSKEMPAFKNKKV